MARRSLPALVLAALALACSSSTTNYAYSGTPANTVAANASLSAQVQVTFDSLGIPYINASSDDDAAYALGYLHARDRLFQMDVLRRAGRGQLAAMLGEAALSQDVTIRTLFTTQTPTASGSYRIEDAIAASLPAAMTSLLQAYANGVNRFLEDLRTGANGAQVPPEYVALNVADPTHPYEPTPWTIEDTLAIGRLLTFQLSESIEAEVNYGQLAQAFLAACGATPPSSCAILGLFADLTRSAPAANAFIIPDANPELKSGAVAAAPSVPGLAEALSRAARFSALLPRLGKKFEVGSNNWVLAPALTAGGVLVANDPHLSLTNPSIWYLAEISTNTRNVGGVTFPGTPVVPIGHNDYIGWGDTVAGYDVSDIFFFPANPATGLPAGVTPIFATSGTIQVRGGESVTETILVVPGYGPVIAAGTTSTPFLTARWTGQEVSDELLAFFDLNQAKSVDEAVTALSQFEVGAQNFVIGDVNGNIAYDPHAYVPIRSAACFQAPYAPWLPMPGGACAWTGRIADSALPFVKNPSKNRVVTANNDITGITKGNNPVQAPSGTTDYVHYLYYTNDLGYRATRIEQRLSAKSSGYTLDDMSSIQSDEMSLFAADLVPGLLAWFAADPTDVQANKLEGAVALLEGWADPANPQQFQTPSGLATNDPGSAAVSDAGILAASNASMLFHALVPRLASRIVDPALASANVVFEGEPLTAAQIGNLVDDQFVAKYLVALSAYAQGGESSVPLATGQAFCGGSCAPQAVEALNDAVTFLASAPVFGSAVTTDWVWGRKHTVTFTSELSPSVTLFDYGPFAKGGGLFTVDVANFAFSNDGPTGFTFGAGPSVRFATQIASGAVKWRAVYPGGQRDYPSWPGYQNQVPTWLTFGTNDLPWGASEIQAAAKSTLVFTQ